jgi:hypothetical protein
MDKDSPKSLSRLIISVDYFLLIQLSCSIFQIHIEQSQHLSIFKFEQHSKKMAIFEKICQKIRKEFSEPEMLQMEVYSKKMQTWVTISVPHVRRDLQRNVIKSELLKWEDMRERSEIPVIPNERERS